MNDKNRTASEAATAVPDSGGSKQHVSVVYVINGTTKSDAFPCKSSVIHLTGVYADQGTAVTLRQDDGQTREIFYRHAEMIDRVTTP